MVPAPVSGGMWGASSGAPLARSQRAWLEAGLGVDLGAVRVHTDTAAGTSARSIGARAYTVGTHIAFAPNQYSPSTPEGQRLLAHEVAHVVQQAGATPAVVRRDSEECPRTWTAATSFASLVDLVREAERQLAACGYTDPTDRVHVLRGIYYGTTWSNDYAVEHSPVRNAGFQTYTASTTPDDPRACLTCGVFAALAASSDVTDGTRHVDFGHLIIGMDARRSSIARGVPIPSQGGTGLDIATWLGDLGGGAAMVARARATNPATRATTRFRGTDFGGSINLEGDVAASVAGRPAGTPTGPAGLDLSSGSVADALAAYLRPSGAPAGSDWDKRCRLFLQMNGGAFGPAGLTNRSVVEADFASKIAAFGCWYLVNRLRQSGGLSLATLRAASLHIGPASAETASIFVDALLNCDAHPGQRLRAVTDPSPGLTAAPPFACDAAIRALELAEELERRARQAEGLLDDGLRELDGLRRRWF